MMKKIFSTRIVAVGKRLNPGQENICTVEPPGSREYEAESEELLKSTRSLVRRSRSPEIRASKRK
jgi:hypothetical protein